MAILNDASIAEINRLLLLFPDEALRDFWPQKSKEPREKKGKARRATKDEIADFAANQVSKREIIRFLYESFSRCKQHVYVRSLPRAVKGLAEVVIPQGERLGADDGGPRLYLLRVLFSVVLDDPPEENEIAFLWPFTAEVMQRHLVIRFVTMEKNLSSYFSNRRCWERSRSIDHKDIISAISGASAEPLNPTDLHKGIKELWASGFADCPRVKFRRPHSTASESMDEEAGIRENNPELYKALQEPMLLDAVFHVDPKSASTVSAYHANPMEGIVVFPRFSARKGDTDHVIREIIKRN